MEENAAQYFDDLKDHTIELQKHFATGSDSKWSILKEYHSKFLLEKVFNQTLTASYLTVLSTLLDSLQPDLFAQEWQEILFDDVFLQGIPHEAFLTLTRNLGEKENYVQQKILTLILRFVQGSSLEAMLMYQCVSHKDWDLKYVSKSNFWDDLITAIVSLPERIANQTKGKFIKLFCPSSYIPLLLHSVFKVFSSIHSRLKNSQDCSLEFLAKLGGRLCTIGNADIVAKKFSKELISLSELDFVWRRISQNFITKMPSCSLDSFITNLLLAIPWYGYVEWILGDEGVKNEKINNIMTVKLLFYRSFKQDIILQNIIGYFASSSSRVSHFMNILDSLLDSWTEEKILRHQSIEQKTYIASALMVCAGWISHLRLRFENKDYINKTTKGVQIRLGSSEEIVRSIGMIVGEHMIKSVDPDAPPLKFEFPDAVVLHRLKSLLDIPPKPVEDSVSIEDFKCFEETQAGESKEENVSLKMEHFHISNNKEELDSDDDLEQYDMSNDISKEGTKRPFYIRECMMGLAQQENAEWVEQCMKHAEELIKANAFATEEIAVEMAKIVLHLDNSLAIPDFIVLRHRILIALTVECPILVSSYLTSQFAQKDYTIRQRLDILEVLAASSALLSRSQLPPSSSSMEKGIVKSEVNWKLIVNQRLEAKTKRFTKSQQPVILQNKFSAVAGNFFFPLLNSFESAGEILKWDGDDSYVLGRFIYTLGIIMCSASNTLRCTQMGTTLLHFLSTIKFHKDPFVRQSKIFAIAATYMTVPSSILFTEMLTEVTETNDWLQSIAQNDPEGNNIEKALYTLSIFQAAAAEGPLLPHHLVKGLTSFN